MYIPIAFMLKQFVDKSCLLVDLNLENKSRINCSGIPSILPVFVMCHVFKKYLLNLLN